MLLRQDLCSQTPCHFGLYDFLNMLINKGFLAEIKGDDTEQTKKLDEAIRQVAFSLQIDVVYNP